MCNQYRAIVAELVSRGVSCSQVKGVIEACAYLFKVTLVGTFASLKSHTRFVLLGAYQVDINTAFLMSNHTNNTILSDGSQKSNKSLLSVNVAIPDSSGKPIIRSLGTHSFLFI